MKIEGRRSLEGAQRKGIQNLDVSSLSCVVVTKYHKLGGSEPVFDTYALIWIK